MLSNALKMETPGKDEEGKIKIITPSERRKIDTIEEIVGDLCRNSKNEMARTTTIFNKAMEKGITGEDVDRILTNLENVGIIWTPTKGYKRSYKRMKGGLL